MARLFPKLSPLPGEDPLIDRLHGGDFNRITGITLPPSTNERTRELVLRVPRWGQNSLKRTVGTIDYVCRNTSIPVATTIAKDFSSENPLGKPYLLQQRLQGSDLETLWDDLNHGQRCTIAREVGTVMRNLLTLESSVTGYMSASLDADTNPMGAASPFLLTNAEGDEFESAAEYTRLFGKPRAKETTLDFFRCQISRWRAVDSASNDLWNSMSKIAEEMSDLGLFTTDLHCLCHTDLYARNIMAQVQENGSISLTGILDWDEAIIAPKFVCCEPPAWLWGFKSDDLPIGAFPIWPYEALGAGEVPQTIEQQEMKRIFEEQAGPEYIEFAYDARYRIARVLSRIALFGLMSNESYEAAFRIVSDWEAIRSSKA